VGTKKATRRGPSWVRVAGALGVVIAVVFAMGSESYAASERRRPQISFSYGTKAKFEYMLAAAIEDVAVSDYTPQKLMSLPVEISQSTGGGNVDTSSCDFGPRTQNN
jgi:hypothetical protein